MLDGDEEGLSRFALDTPSDLRCYLEDECNVPIGDSIQLPKNLKLIATMNVADESLRPLDAAFRRRWDWMEVDPLHYSTSLEEVLIEGEATVRWIDFIEDLNTRILQARPGEDCRVGAFFVLPQNSVIQKKQIGERLFPYLPV